jgi:hypothetical protein
MRNRERHDDPPEDLAIRGPEAARDADEQRVGLYDSLIHHDHAGEERGVKEHHHLCELPNSEIDDDERDEGDRRERTEEIDERIDDPARRLIPAEDECNRNGKNDPASQTQDHTLARHINVEPKAVRGQLFPKRRPDLDRAGNQSGADDARERDELPDQDNQAPGQQSKRQSTQVVDQVPDRVPDQVAADPRTRTSASPLATGDRLPAHIVLAGHHRELRPGFRRGCDRRQP